ncbi:MAG: ATP-binding cassette domain-containing protein [Bacteroidia bacterium]|nr:ATP-binding cassette domain-containing protein [Bacteroidia bacterium]
MELYQSKIIAPPSKLEKVIEIAQLKKAFGRNEVLKGFDMELNKAENLVILGRSGSGKTVLTKCIVGLLRPDSGKLVVLGNDIFSLSTRELDLLRRKIGFLFQGSALYDSMTVRENLEFPLRHVHRQISESEVEELVEEMLESVGLSQAIDLMPSELSGGMKKRIALARTLILKPEIIIYDEPTGGLDPITTKEISYLILEMQEKYQTSSLIISHDLVCTEIIANKIIVLIDGINYASGTYQELFAHEDPMVRAFFH